MTMATTQHRACSMSLMNKGDEAIKGLPLPLLAQSGRALRFETCLLLRPNRKPVVRFIDSAIRRPSLSYRRVTRSLSSGAHRRASLTNPPCSADRSCVICPTGCLAKFVSSPRAKNFLLSRLVEAGIERIIPSHTTGRFANVTDVGAGCDGREQHADDVLAADGEVVWS